MTIAQFRKQLTSNTNYKLQIKTYSFGKQASYICKDLTYAVGDIMIRARYNERSIDLTAFHNFMDTITIEVFASLYSDYDINLSNGRYTNDELKTAVKL